MSAVSAVPDSLAARLPFAVDDYPAAGRAFAAWRASGLAADGEAVQLWAYCYVQRHLYGRFARERWGSASDVDDAISRAFLDVVAAFPRITDPSRFASYVSVICKRTVLGHRDRRQTTVEVDDEVLPPQDADEADPFAAEAVRADIEAALAELPPSVVDVARMRYLDRLDYETIAARTGRPLASVRTYAARAAERLRADPFLRAHHFDDLLPPGADGQPRTSRDAA